MRDKLTALEAQLTCQLLSEGNKGELSPVLGRLDREEGAGVRSKDSVNIQKDCLSDRGQRLVDVSCLTSISRS